MNIHLDSLTQAAACFALRPDRLTLLGGMDGLAYAYAHDGRDLVLKVTPLPADHPEQLPQTLEKFAFVHYLAENGVPAAAPLPSPRGVLAEVIAGPDGEWIVSLTERAHGRHPSGQNPQDITPQLFRRWGQTMGRMHALARRYPQWRKQAGSLIADWRDEHALFADLCQEDDIRDQWMALRGPMESYPIERDSYGLVHNDLHPNNFLVDDAGRLTVIDFDVCAYYWFVTDLAIPLFFMNWWGPPRGGKPHEPFVAEFFSEFMGGYAMENQLSQRWMAALPFFLRHHQMLLYIFFSSQLKSNPQPWMEPALKTWREEILHDIPVVKIPLPL